MKDLAYFKIEEDMTPRDASDALEMAKKAGFDEVIVYHHEKADITNASYLEQLLSLFRGAYRHKVALYIADDRYDFSGTGFGQLSSVKELWQKVMVIKEKSEVCQGEEILCEYKDNCVVATLPPALDKFPYGHMPDLTNPDSARLIIEGVYKPLINEFKKFVGYEFRGFLCNCPIWDCAEYETVPYSKAAVERFLEDAPLPEVDLFFAAAKEESPSAGWSDYLECFDIEESFVLPLKKFCDENNLELAIATGTSSVSEEFGKENSSIFINPYGDNCYMPDVAKSYDAVLAYKHKCGCVIKIAKGMEMLKNIGRIFEEYPNCDCVKLCDFKGTDKNCCVLINHKKEEVSLGLLMPGEWAIYDWERDIVYDFEPKRTYTFPPESFLCLVKKEGAMYPEPLGIKAGGVITKELEVAETIPYKEEGGKFTFTLPGEGLSGKYIELAGDGGYVAVKLGYNQYKTLTRAVYPLYDFLCGQECRGETDGKITEIRIMKETEA
ncbi:MAG: hypothetical protein IJO83_09015 [Clostridia bacterium]|nr:hypothetical protein [Clostridia bacterium]